MKAKKVKGFMLLPAVLMSILLGMLALSFLQIYGGHFSALSASRKALQAQQFAQSEADFLRNVSYDELDSAAHIRQAIDGATGWMSEVTLADETTVNEVQQRMATVNVYRNSTVTSPDFSLQVPLSSASGGTDKFPVGTILPYVGDIKDIPKGWALCDGTNETPDLSGRFLEGVTANPKSFKEAGLPNIQGSLVFCNGYHIGSATGAFILKRYTSAWVDQNANWQSDLRQIDFNASNYKSIYSDDITTVQPSSYTVYYIMKVKK